MGSRGTPWIAWAWVVHGFLYAGLVIFLTVRMTLLRVNAGEDITSFQSLVNLILASISSLVFLAASITLIVKPHFGGIFVYFGKLIGKITLLLLIVNMLTGNIISQKFVQYIMEALRYTPTMHERVWVVIIGLILGLVNYAVLLLLYALICLVLGYLIHRMVGGRKEILEPA